MTPRNRPLLYVCCRTFLEVLDWGRLERGALCVHPLALVTFWHSEVTPYHGRLICIPKARPESTGRLLALSQMVHRAEFLAVPIVGSRGPVVGSAIPGAMTRYPEG